MYGVKTIKALRPVDASLVQRQCQGRTAMEEEPPAKSECLALNYKTIQEKGAAFFVMLYEENSWYHVSLIQAIRKQATPKSRAKITSETLTSSKRFQTLKEAKESKIWITFAGKEPDDEENPMTCQSQQDSGEMSVVVVQKKKIWYDIVWVEVQKAITHPHKLEVFNSEFRLKIKAAFRKPFFKRQGPM